MQTVKEVSSLFQYNHLPPHLQKVSKPFHELAVVIFHTVPDPAMRTKALNELWQSKNWAVAGVAQT